VVPVSINEGIEVTQLEGEKQYNGYLMQRVHW
jgi:hypothetical protein